MDCMHFLFVPKGMTKEVLEKLYVKFYQKHFMRIKTLLGFIAMIWRSPDSWKRFLLNIGGFLRFAMTDKRIADTRKKRIPEEYETAPYSRK